MQSKDSWFILLYDERNPTKTGIGECGLLKGLSIDDRPDYENKLQEVCSNINNMDFYLTEGLDEFPSIRFGLEMALLDLNAEQERILFPSDFVKRHKTIEINGLVWMGDFDFMKRQIEEKVQAGYSCIKLKIGAIDFEREIELLNNIRQEYSASEIEIRVDANGAFISNKALDKLKRLAEFDLHSIEQPIKQGQWDLMAELCLKSPLAIALDEELIGISSVSEKKKLLKTIQPQYIILKPSLLGGFKASQEWIDLADSNDIAWWVTSALESNIGLNAIAQWTYTLNNRLPQGLGTGQLYTNNFDSPLQIKNGKLLYSTNSRWNLKPLFK